MRLRGVITIGAAILLSIPAHAQTFEQVLESAYKNHPRLSAERERVREADETFVQARALGRPTLGADIQAIPTVVRIPNDTFQPGLTGNTTEFIVTRQAGVSVIQPLYTGGRVKASKRQAKAGILAARELLRDAEQGVLQAAANAYADTVRNAEAARIRRNNVSVLLRQKEAAQVRFDVGAGTRTDIALADTRLAQAQVGLAQAEAALKSSLAALESATGISASPSLSPVPPIAIPASLVDARAIATSSNPQLRAALYNETAALAAIDIARSQSKPQISLNGQVGFIREGLGGLRAAETAQVTAQVTVPFYAGGANKSRVRQAQAARNRAVFESRDAERIVIENVNTLYAQLEAANASIEAARSQIAAAEIAFEGVELENEVGTRTALDVLDAEQELLEARLIEVNAIQQRNLVTFQILALLGAFDADSLSIATDYDADAYLRDILDNGVIDTGFDSFEDTELELSPTLIGPANKLVTDTTPVTAQTGE